MGNASRPATGPASSASTVSWIVTPVSASPAMIARSTGAAPRQRGRSEGWTLSHGRSASSAGGIEQPVRADDDRRRAEIEPRRGPLRLKDGDPEPLGDDLRRRRGEPAAASRRRIGPCQERCDLVARREPPSTSAPKGAVAATAIVPWRSARGRGGGGASPSASRRDSASVRSMHELAVEVVDLVLDDTCAVALELERIGLAFVVLRLDRDPQGALDRHAHAPEREAALGCRISLSSPTGITTGFTIGLSSPSSVQTKKRRRMPTCVAASPTPSASCISWIIRSLDRTKLLVELLDLVRAHPQHRIAVLADLRERDLLADEPLGLRLASSSVSSSSSRARRVVVVVIVCHGRESSRRLPRSRTGYRASADLQTTADRRRRRR